MAGAAFAHGVHPPQRKELTAELPLRRLPFPEEVVLPLRQHAGKPAIPIVKRGDRVERGDLVAEADGFISSPVHASASGTVVDVDFWPHPDGSWERAVRIRVDGASLQLPRPRVVPRWETLAPAQLVEWVRRAGLVGLGGAAFPAHVKLSPPPEHPIDSVLVNGAECEPYLTADHRTMVEYPERVHLGLRIVLRALGAARGVIGVELNKPDAIAALRRTAPTDLDVSVVGLEVKYPQGAEKMLIRALLGREVPGGKLPMHVGALVQNVGSIATIAEVFETGLPLVERIVTVSGSGVARPANLIVPVGTKLRDLLAHCGGLTDDASEIVFGGPMMGVSVCHPDVPLLKGTTGVVVLTEAEVRPAASHPCIRCGRCLEACPLFLDPQRLGSLAKAGRYQEMEEAHLADCMLCGCCAYACPSNIPLAHLFRLSKDQLRRRKTRAAWRRRA